MRQISLDESNIFLVNPENGRWAITKKTYPEKLETLLKKPLPKKSYSGTEILVLNSSNICNLDCSYCSETIHRGIIPPMPFESARKVIEKDLEMDSPLPIVFHGSEPTMNFDWIKRVVLYGTKRMQEKNKSLSFSIQSNLAELPEGFLDFISKYKVGVSTSMDGDAEVQNRTRPYTTGKPSFNDVIFNMRKVLSYQGNLNVATVVTKFNVNKLEQISEFLESEGVTSWQTIPAEGNYKDASKPVELGDSYISLFDNIFNRISLGKQKLEVRTLAQYLSSFFIHNGIDACRICSSSNSQPLLAIDHDGEVYPCDYFWGDKNTRIGNIKIESIERLSKSGDNLRMRNINETGCSDCTWKMNCGGGCLSGSYYSEDKRSPYCVTHKKVYNHLAKKMPELIKKDLIKPVLSWLRR